MRFLWVEYKCTPGGIFCPATHVQWVPGLGRSFNAASAASIGDGHDGSSPVYCDINFREG